MRIARKEIGVREIDGGPNARIKEYLATLDCEDDDDWCSCFATWVLRQAGLDPKSTPAARSFRKVGKPIANPRKGCIVVLWRGSPDDWRGHVGFLVNATDKNLHLLGGNQGRAVSIKAYPRERLLDYRWPE